MSGGPGSGIHLMQTASSFPGWKPPQSERSTDMSETITESTVHPAGAAAPANPLGYESIPRLMLKFAVPSVVAMIINSIYNIVDQIFIGRGVGYLGNASTNIVVPLVTIVMALGLMIGDGAAAYVALNLGIKREKDAAAGAGTAIITSAFVGIIMIILCEIFAKPLFLFFGATETIMPYALTYGRVIIAGFLFCSFSCSVSGIIRADGRPRHSMAGMIMGCVANMILDPLFIFVFHWGVFGAALATILGQGLTMCWFLICLRKMKTIPLTRADLRIDLARLKKVCTLGLSSFFNQVASVVVIIIINRCIINYGDLSVYGSDIALAVFGIVMKVNMIVMCIPIGISSGSAPIFSFNYSAGNFDRVKKTLKYAMIVSTAIMVVAFVIYRIFPRQIIGLFGSESELYNQFGEICFRIHTTACFLMPTSAVIGIFFQSIGKPVQSTIISLARQVLILVPAALIFGALFGLEGVLAAGPTGDAAVIAAVTLIVMWKKIFDPEVLKQKNFT